MAPANGQVPLRTQQGAQGEDSRATHFYLWNNLKNSKAKMFLIQVPVCVADEL